MKAVKSNKKSTNMKKIVIFSLLGVLLSMFIYAQTSKTSETSTTELVLTDENFEELVINSDKIVMVDFWATWCKPCLMMAPIVKGIADEYDSKIVVGKLDVDKNPVISQKYMITSIPTILFIKDGKVVDTSIGYVTEDYLKEKIDALLD